MQCFLLVLMKCVISVFSVSQNRQTLDRVPNEGHNAYSVLTTAPRRMAILFKLV
jgi:hypothetical protein